MDRRGSLVSHISAGVWDEWEVEMKLQIFKKTWPFVHSEQNSILWLLYYYTMDIALWKVTVTAHDLTHSCNIMVVRVLCEKIKCAHLI